MWVCNGSTDILVDSIISINCNIKYFDINFSDEVSKEVLKKLGKFKHLTVLHLKCQYNLDDEVLDKFTVLLFHLFPVIITRLF